ncbi:hypothetical protein A4G18_08995 [Pasteurellaceae bacterium Pebbles2]|nr:hypothetical protein [Pasteurellaceae bacterium Pebbles2]
MKKLLLATALLAASTTSLAVNQDYLAKANKGSALGQIAVGMEYSKEGNYAKAIYYQEKGLSNIKKLKKEFKKEGGKEMDNMLLALIYEGLSLDYYRVGNKEKSGNMVEKACKAEPSINPRCPELLKLEQDINNARARYK